MKQRMQKMKRVLSIIILLMLLCASALAEPARDVTMHVALDVPSGETNVRYMRDGNEKTGTSAPGNVKHYLYITPKEDSVAAVYIEFGLACSSFDVETRADGDWQVIASYENPGYAQAALQFAPQSERFRLHFRPLKQGDKLSIRELRVFTQGEMDPQIVHVWQPAPEKADILFLVAHPDDEILWFGGAIPACVDAGRSVQVGYLTCADKQRRLELLNGLWICGLRTYPEIGSLRDFKGKQETILESWGRRTATNIVVRMIRRYRPEVIVTHDLKGEYGHPQHILCAQLLLEAVELAADAGYLPDEAAPWQVKKAYVHLGDTPTTVMNWDLPLASFGGQTGIALARAAMECHISQESTWKVAAAGDRYDSTLYTLAYSVVGEDEAGDDFFEHVAEARRK